MKNLELGNRLAIYIFGVVAVIFLTAMLLVYVNSKESLEEVELANEQTDLSHTAEMLDLLVSMGMPASELERHAESPWEDGSYKDAYDLVRADSVEAVERQIKEKDPEAIVLKAPLHNKAKHLVLLEKYNEVHTMCHVHEAMERTIALATVVMLLMGIAIYLAVKFLLRPETERRTRINTELKIAQRLQDKMLPSLDKLKVALKNVEVEAWIKSAKQIGGDYYNALKVGDELHFIIADVSGKGIPAAMFLMRLTEMYQLVLMLQGDQEPSKIANELNQRLCEGNAAYMFATAIIGRLNLNTHRLEICAAGHEPPLIITDDGETSFMTLDNDVPLGLEKGYEFKVHASHLNEGCHLLLYTDGITEAEDEKLELFGSKRLAQVMRGQGGNSPKQVMDHLIKHIRTFTGIHEQSDDITLLDIKLHHSNAPQGTMLTLKNELNELNKLLEMADAMNFPSNATLAMEEAFVNVVNYSHATAITVEVSQQDGILTIEIADDGDPFDPTQHQTPPDDEAVDQDGFVKVGGKGINLIMSLIKDVAYQRTDETNILTLKTDI